MFTLATTLLWGLAELFYKKGSHEEENSTICAYALWLAL